MCKAEPSNIYSIVFNLPNSVGFVRLILMLIGYCFVFSQPLIWYVMMQLSGCLDMLDGWLARKFNQQSKLGQCFDMVLDRIYENTACIMMCLIYPHYYLLFVAIIIIDLSSHFMLIYKTHLYHQSSHKAVSSANFLLVIYYNNRFALTSAVIFYENFLGFLYLYHFYPLKWIFTLALICLPGALFKFGINIIQLFYSIKCIAQYDLENPF